MSGGRGGFGDLRKAPPGRKKAKFLKKCQPGNNSSKQIFSAPARGFFQELGCRLYFRTFLSELVPAHARAYATAHKNVKRADGASWFPRACEGLRSNLSGFKMSERGRRNGDPFSQNKKHCQRLAAQCTLRRLRGSVRCFVLGRVICRGRAVKRRHGAVCGLYGHCMAMWLYPHTHQAADFKKGGKCRIVKAGKNWIAKR